MKKGARRPIGSGRSRSRRRVKTAPHRDVYPVGRVATEFFLRSVDVIGQLHGDVLSCLIILSLWQGGLCSPAGPRPKGIRELSRQLDVPFETVRRHVRKLVRKGICLIDEDGIDISAAMRRSAGATDVLRKIYFNAARMLSDLKRIEVISYAPRQLPPASTRQLGPEQLIIAAAAIGFLLTAVKMLRRSFDGDLMRALVFTAIRAANVKHITNTSPAASRGILPDAQRQPVRMLAISDSMRLPYETVRRHARKLVKDGKCTRVGNRGLIVPARTFTQLTAESNSVRQVVLDFLANLRSMGVKV